MMIVNLPRSVRRAVKSGQKTRLSINAILRAAYRKHGRSRLTEAAVKRCLRTAH